MAKVNCDWSGDWSGYKKASWYKVWWCALRHVKKFKVYAVSNAFTGIQVDVKVYGCMKCNIWKRTDGE